VTKKRGRLVQRTDDGRSSPATEEGRLIASAFVKAMVVDKLRRDKPAGQGEQTTEEPREMVAKNR
jgi:hypothetical protein